MFFRPSFCANCGEKIERTEWGLWTSRRFCIVCESQYKGHDIIPRLIVGSGILVGILGFGSYLKSSEGVQAGMDVRRPQQLALRDTSSKDMPGALAPAASNSLNVNSPGSPGVKNPVEPSSLVEQKRAPVVKAVISEPIYYCGAETKKGTPCSRRVKGNVRCFQHTGMPAMLTADKLKIAETR